VLQHVSRDGLDLGGDVQAELRAQVNRLGQRIDAGELSRRATERAGGEAGAAVQEVEEKARDLLRGVLGGEKE
jgi:hypothetical protein